MRFSLHRAITWGPGAYFAEYTRVCVSEGVISGLANTLTEALAVCATAAGASFETEEGDVLGKDVRKSDIEDSISRTQYRRGTSRQSTSFPTWPQPVP